MNKKVNKDLNFLKGKKISRKGIFDNKEVYENTLKAFETIINSDYILEIQVRMLKDGTLILFDEEDMERLLHVEGSIDKLTFEELEFMAKYEILTFDKFLNLRYNRYGD